MYIINSNKTINGKNKNMFINNTLDLIDNYREQIFMSTMLSMEGL